MPGRTLVANRSSTFQEQRGRLRAWLVVALCAALTALGLVASPAAYASAPTGTALTVRGGDTLYTGGLRCAVSFNATDGTDHFGIVPGHCAGLGDRWYADPGLTQPVGTSTLAEWPGHDYGLVRYDDGINSPAELTVGGSHPRVTGVQQAAVGARLCQAGSTTGVHCGTITETNASVSFPEGVVHGLIRSNLCSEVGDQGSPAYVSDGAGVRGVGFTMGGTSCQFGGQSFHTPLATVLNATGLSVVY